MDSTFHLPFSIFRSPSSVLHLPFSIFHFPSTCSVYGASDQILDERSALNSVSLYARSKIGSERVLLTLNKDRFAPVILRFGAIYGLSPRPRFDLVINRSAELTTKPAGGQSCVREEHHHHFDGLSASFGGDQ